MDKVTRQCPQTTCSEKMFFKGSPSKASSCHDNITNLQYFHLLIPYGLSTNIYGTEVLFCLELELLGALSCWLLLINEEQKCDGLWCNKVSWTLLPYMTALSMTSHTQAGNSYSCVSATLKDKYLNKLDHKTIDKLLRVFLCVYIFHSCWQGP